MRLLVNEWSKNIKTKSWLSSDHISIGQTNHLINLLNSIFISKIPSPSNGFLPMGFHFLFNNQSNNNLGSDGYDNYQAPYNVQTNKGLFSRRMWVKGSIINKKRPPAMGEIIDCRESISSVRYLSGMAFVDIKRNFYKYNDSLLEENRTLIYTNEKFATNNSRCQIDIADGISTTIKISRQDILKFSMLTYNMHKIHYDKIYCQQVENLPDIIVQGPFMVTLILHWFCNMNTACTIESFSYKNIEPCFVDQNVKLYCSQTDNNRFKLQITNEDSTKVFMEGKIITF